MTPPVKKYGAKRVLTRSTSESAMNALFVTNMCARYRRKHKQTRKRLDSKNLPELPPIDANHDLLDDSDSSFHVKRANDTFDQLKMGPINHTTETNTPKCIKSDTTDEITPKSKENNNINLSNSHDKSEIISKNCTSPMNQEILSYSSTFDSTASKSGSSKRKKSPEAVFSLDESIEADLNISISKVRKNSNNLGKSVVCSTPITENKKLKALHVLTPVKVHDTASHELINESVQQVYNWSYKSPEVSAYNHITMQRGRRYNGELYNNENINNIHKTPEKNEQSMMKWVARRKKEPTNSTSSISSPPPRMVALKFASNQSPPHSGHSGTASAMLSKCIPLKIAITRLPDEYVLDKLEKQSFVEESLPKQDLIEDVCDVDDLKDFELCVGENPSTEDTASGMDLDNFEKFYTSTINTIMSSVDENASCFDVDSSNHNDNISADSTKSIRRRRFTQNITKRRQLPRKAKKSTSVIDYSNNSDCGSKYDDVSVEKSKSEEVNHVPEEKQRYTTQSPDLFASTLFEELNHEVILTSDEESQPECKEEAKEDIKEEKCDDVDKEVEENKEDKNDDTGNNSDCFVKPCMKKKPTSNGPLAVQPGKAWRRSLAFMKRNTMVASVLQGETCTCPDCAVPNLNNSIVARQTIMKLSREPVERRRTSNMKYEHNQFRDTVALEALIENISLNASKLDVDHDPDEDHARICPFASELVLQRCKQTAPINFSQWYPETLLRNCLKIGEGVYGEVFRYRNADSVGTATVMKVIPIEGEMLVNGERQKQFEEILSEIVIASELSNLRYGLHNQTTGFNQLKSVRCVQGVYPARLIELWELFEENRGTENDNPKMFGEDQLYIVLEMANAGSDLESFVFANYNEVYDVFIQIALALAVAEEEVQFEHRDLHWGNVLINRVQKDTRCNYKLDGESITIPASTVEANIIDFTLSRITYDNIHFYNDLAQDPDLFNAEGDYQFEIYKLMQLANRNDWEPFHPETNIFWLHYILIKLTTAVHLVRKTVKGRNKKYLHTLVDWENVILKYKSAKHFVVEVILPHVRQK